MNLPGEVIEKLGHYVYLYIDPRDDSVFYVGKGTGSRCLSYLSATGETEKAKRIAAIKAGGHEPRIDILVHGLPAADTALQVEAAVIDLFARGQLTNKMRGWNSAEFGRMELKQLVSLYDSKPIKIEEPALLIRINQKFHFGMKPIDLYDATRGIWRIGPDREKVEFAFAVFQGVVREVYEVKQWFPAGTTFSTRHEDEDLNDPGRWEFVGGVAEEAIRNKYVDGSVAHYFQPHAQNPFMYLNVKEAE